MVTGKDGLKAGRVFRTNAISGLRSPNRGQGQSHSQHYRTQEKSKGRKFFQNILVKIILFHPSQFLPL
jgi:hypothetical protein